MTIGYSAGALAITLLAIAYLGLIDPKRRRVFATSSSKWLPHSRIGGWALVLFPGLFLILVGQLSAFLIWFGASTVASWGMAARRPRRS